MYSVIKQSHPQYGDIIEIIRDEGGPIKAPFEAFNTACRLRRELIAETGNKIKILVDGQIMTVSSADKWFNNEYKSLPKCEECGKILSGRVYTNRFSGVNLFCSQDCSNKNFLFKIEGLDDNDETEFDL